MMNWLGGIILVCFFLSGASGLIYEVIWQRMLVLVFGSTTLAVSTVLTAFMAGLALGSLWFGRVIDRWQRPLLTYGVLEGGIALCGLLVPVLLPKLVPIYQLAWEHFSPSFYLFSLLRFVLAITLLLIPTTLMGATLPVLASFYAGRKERSERRIGLLYGLNTAGAVLGTFASGFILLPMLGVIKTTLLAAALNLVLGVIVMFIAIQRSHLVGPSMLKTDRDRRTEGLDQPEPSFAAMAYASPREGGSSSKLAIVLSLIALAISGYTALVYEVAWTRVLSLVLGSSIYAFSTMLSTFLLGLALGSILFTQLLNRIRWPVGIFALVQIGIALTCYASTFFLEKLPYFFLRVLAWGLPDFQDHPDWLIMALWFISAFGIMIIPTLLFGGTFPLVVKIYHLYTHQIGRTTGDVYSVNTLGAIVGAFLAGFVLIPVIGLPTTLLLTILINLALGMLLMLAAPFRNTNLQKIMVASIVVLGVGLLWVKVPWNPTMMTFNLGIEYPRYLEMIKDLQGKGWGAFNERLNQGLDVIFYEEGSNATVTVVRDAVGHHYLKNDGRPEGGEAYLRTHVLLGQLPLLLSSASSSAEGKLSKEEHRREPESVMIIGLGTGVTLGSAQQYPLKRIKVVELEPAVIRASDYFRNFSPHQLDDPRLQIIVDDGRNHLLANPETYDTIISQPSFPWLTGVANLFTQDFFRLGAQRLRKGGVFCQWVSIYGMTQESFKSVLKAFYSVFPHVMVFDPAPPDMILIGSNEPIQIDLARLEEKMSNPSIRSDLARIGIETPYDLLATFSLGTNEMETYVAEVVTNTDDNAWVEVSGPRDYYTGRINGQPEVIRDGLYKAQRGIEGHLVGAEVPNEEQEAFQLLELAQAYFRQRNFAYASFYADRSLRLKESAQGHLLMARLLTAYTQEAPQGGLTLSNRQNILEAAIKATDVALGLNPKLKEALQLQADLYQGQGDVDQAILSYQRLVEVDPKMLDARYTLASLLQAQGRHKEAKQQYQKFLAQASKDKAYSELVDLVKKQLQVMGR